MSSFANFDDELAFLKASGHDDLDRDETDEMLLQYQLTTSPLLNFAAVKHHAEAFPSRGLLGTTIGERFYMNTNTPSSGVICGVQVSLVWALRTDVADWNTGLGLRQEPHPILYFGGLPGRRFKDRATASTTHSTRVGF